MKHFLFVFTVWIALSLFAGSSVFAASATWDGGSGPWATGSNWNTNSAPGDDGTTPTNSGSTATFSTGTGTVTIDAGRNIGNITFASGTGAYTFSGGPLVLTSGDTISIANGATAAETFNTPIALEGGYTFANNNVTSASALNFGGNIINASNGNEILSLNGTTGSGTNTISGSIGNGGGQIALSIGGTVGNNWILSAANTFAGNTTINSGSTLQIQNNNALQNSSVNIGTTNGLLFSTGNSIVNLAGLAGASNETLQDGVTNIGNAVTLQLGLYNNTGGNYTGILSGTGGITKFGTGTQSFGNGSNNTYTGTTTVTGFLGDTLSTTLNTTIGTPFGTGNVVMNGGTLKIMGTRVAALTGVSNLAGSTFTYAGDDILFLQKGTGLTYTIGNATPSGSVLVRSGNGNLIIQTNTAGDLGIGGSTGEDFVLTSGAPTMNGTNDMVSASLVTLNGGSASNGDFLTYGSNGFASDSAKYTTLTTPVTAGTTTSTEIGNVTATTAFSGNNTLYAFLVQSGITATINAGITLTVAGDGTTDGVILNKATIAGGSAASTLNFGTAAGLIYSFNGTSTLSVPITGSGGVTFAGNQAFNFGNPSGSTLNASTYTGGANIEGVTFNFKTTNDSSGMNDDLSVFGAPTNTITLNGATLSGNTVEYDARTVVLGPAGASIGAGATLAFNMSGSGALTLTGSNLNTYGVLTGNNTYTGGTNINGVMIEIASESNIGGPSAPITFLGSGGSGLSIMGTSLTSLSNPLSFVANSGPYLFDIQSPDNASTGNYFFTLNQALNFGTGGFEKDGLGALVLTNAENYSGTTTVNGGVLKVDESRGGSLSPLTPLDFSGGTLYILGAASGTTTQTLGNVTLGSKINASPDTTGGAIVVDSNVSNGGTGTTVNLGTLPVNGGANPGGGLQLQLIGAASSITTTSQYDASSGTGGSTGNGIYGARVVITNSSGVTDWATSITTNTTSPNIIVNYTGYDSYSTDDDKGNSGDNDQLTSAGTFTSGGSTTINTLKIANTTGTGALDLGANSATLTLQGGGLLFTGTSAYTISGGTILSGLTTGTANETASNTTYTGATSDLIIQDYGTAPLTISSNISNGVTGGGQGEFSDLTKTGPGTLILTGANGYTGTTFIDGGILQISSDSNIGGNNGVITVASSSTNSAMVNLDSATLPVGFGVGATFLGKLVTAISGTTVTLSGNANTALSSQSASYATDQYLVIDGGTLQVDPSMANTTVTLQESNSAGAAGTSTGNVNRPIQIGSDGATFNMLNGSTLTIEGIQTFTAGAGAAAITVDSSDGSGGVLNLAFNGNSTIAGGWIINGGTLLSNFQGDLGQSGFNTITFGSGIENSVATHPTLILPATNPSSFIAGLDSPAGSTAVVENGAGASSLLYIMDGGADTYTGLLNNNTSGTLTLIKGGSGTQNLTNPASTYLGATKIDDGVLNVASFAIETNVAGTANSAIGASSNAAANLVFGGGPVGSAILQYTGSAAQTTDRLFTLGDTNSDNFIQGDNGAIDASGSVASATVTFNNMGPIAFNPLTTAFTHNLTLTGTNTGTASTMNTFAPLLGDQAGGQATSVSKTGTGSWALTNANTYSGGTTVTGGTLYANDTTAATSSTGTGSVTVGNGGALSGTGIIAPAGNNGITVAAGGNVAPGGVQTAVGTFTSYTGVSTNKANGSTTLSNANITTNGTILAANANAGLTFAIGTGAPNGVNTVSRLLVTGNLADIMNFNVGGTIGPGGTSTVVTINDLVGANLATSMAIEYVLINGNNATTYEDNGVQLGMGATTGDLGAYNAAVGGNQILGGLSLLSPTNANYFSEAYQSSKLYLVGDNIVLAIPEPGTWALMLGGLGLLVFFLHRKRHQVLECTGLVVNSTASN